MSVRNSFASLNESDDDEPKQQVKKPVTAKPKAPAAAAPARNNNRRDDRPRRDDNRNRGGRRGEYNRESGDSNARKYRRDDRRTDRRRDADRKDRRREGNNNDRRDNRRGRNQYEKTHQKRGPKKAGHGGWGTDKDAVAAAEEETTATATTTAETPTEDASEETPSEPAAPAVRELTLEEHEAAEKERRAKFNERWGSKPAAVDVNLEKEFSGMAVVGKKSRKAEAESGAAGKKSAKTATKSAQKAKELKKAIFAEPTHFASDDRGRGYGGRGRGGGRGGRGGRGRNRGHCQNCLLVRFVGHVYLDTCLFDFVRRRGTRQPPTWRQCEHARCKRVPRTRVESGEICVRSKIVICGFKVNFRSCLLLSVSY